MEMDWSSSTLLHLFNPQSYLSIPITLKIPYNQGHLMAYVRHFTNIYSQDEGMIVDHHHYMGRSVEDRSVWVYWDDHIQPCIPSRLLVTDDFGNLVEKD